MSINIGDLLGGLTGGGKDKDKGTSGSGGGGGGDLVKMVLPALTGMLSGGGLQKLLGGLQAKGLTSQVDSWKSGGSNEPVSAADIKDAMGDDELEQVAGKANVSKDQAADAISKVLPQLVDKASPSGKLPDQDGLSSLLGSLTKQLGR
jgi:uncharacterized protein YidB (DUF937 family)